MERLLLLWDEVDDWLAAGRHVTAGALSETVGHASGAARSAAVQLQSLASSASGWISRRRAD